METLNEPAFENDMQQLAATEDLEQKKCRKRMRKSRNQIKVFSPKENIGEVDFHKLKIFTSMSCKI